VRAILYGNFEIGMIEQSVRNKAARAAALSLFDPGTAGLS
jgi:hypothetical protein